MGFLDRLTGDGDGDATSGALEARRDEDLRRLAAGGVPVAAEQRLQELAGGTTGFTSNLSVADFALTRLEQIRPICQVMGSSVYQVGWQRYPYSGSGGLGRPEPQIVEFTQVARAWNEARRLALARLSAEATIAGAHAVVDVSFQTRPHAFLAGEIEIVVVGTAVHLPEGGRDGPPVLTDLSMPDFVLLRRAGYVPVGVVTATAAFYVVASDATRRLTTGWQRGTTNTELTDFTQGVYTARETALAHAQAQAESIGAHGLVGVTITHDIRTRAVDQGGSSREDLIVTFHVLATGIYQHAEHRPMQPRTVVRQNAKPRPNRSFR